MPRRIHILSAFLCLLLPACSEPDPDPVFSLPEDPVPVGYKGGKTQVTFVTNNDWEASTDAAWLRFSPTSGSARFLNDHTLYLTLEENAGVDRDCDIVIRSLGEEKRIHVRQQHAPLVLETALYEVSIDEQSLAIPFFSDEEPKIEMDEAGANWARLAKTTRSSFFRDTVWLDVAANRSGTRTAEISFTCPGKTVSVCVRQAANLVPVDPFYLESYWLQKLDFNKDGQFCMDDADLVTEIKCYVGYQIRNYYMLHNLYGWEYFPHLKVIDAKAQTADNFDFRFYKELESVVMTAPIQDPDLTTNANLRKLELSGARGKASLKNLKYLSDLWISGCSEMDLEGTTNLKYFLCNAISSEILDLGPQTQLQSMTVNGTEYLKAINTSQLPTLTEVYLHANNAIETLDLTFQSQLASVYLFQNPNLKTVYVKKRPQTFFSDLPVTLIVVE